MLTLYLSLVYITTITTFAAYAIIRSLPAVTKNQKTSRKVLQVILYNKTKSVLLRLLPKNLEFYNINNTDQLKQQSHFVAHLIKGQLNVHATDIYHRKALMSRWFLKCLEGQKSARCYQGKMYHSVLIPIVLQPQLSRILTSLKKLDHKSLLQHRSCLWT